jgi:uncharacterized protein (DUF1778 family)
MATATKREARLNFRLSNDLKLVIEEAAATLGQSVSDFAVSTLAKNAREVLDSNSVTKLSARDRDRVLAALDDADRKPNKALREAAKRYKKRMGR